MASREGDSKEACEDGHTTVRRQDVLTPLKERPARRKRFLTFDIESKKDDTQDKGFTRPFYVGIHDGVSFVAFRDEPHLARRSYVDRHIQPGGCIDKAMNYMLSSRFSGCSFYGHNAGSFDWLFVPAWLRRHEEEFSFSIVPVQSSIQKFTIDRIDTEYTKRRKKKDTYTLLDSMKLFPGKLEKMLNAFQVGSKVKHDLDLHEDDPRWEAYLRQDCVGLYEALVRYHELIERMGGEVGMTAPSTAMKLFRRKFLGKGETPSQVPRHSHFGGCPDEGKPTYQPGDCEGCCHTYIRRAYYGGRTEVIRAWGENFRYYDINSSYVASMLAEMPAGDRYVEENPQGIDEVRAKRYIAFVECVVEIPESCYLPPLPHRRKGDGKLVFPTGRFSGVWDLDELRLLKHPLVNGRILKVRRIVWYRRQHLFRDMVKVLWQYRDKDGYMDGNALKEFEEGLSELAKLMGNSSYGKFGMNQERMQIVRRLEVGPEYCFLCAAYTPNREGLCPECVGSKSASGDPECPYWYQRRFTDAPYIIPQISAHITSLSRISLWNFAAEALMAGSRVYYMDTDSCLTNAAMPSSKKLGEFKDEHPGKLLEGDFVQPKVYRICETVESHRARYDVWTTKLGAWLGSTLDADALRLEPSELAHVLGGLDPALLDRLPAEMRSVPVRLGDKVTMKGFPSDMRTAENLARLRDGGVLEFERLQKVRTLAREDFAKPPKMVGVKKSFKLRRSDKRILMANGDTRPIAIYDDTDEAAE